MNDLSQMQQGIIVPTGVHRPLPRGVFEAAYNGTGFRARVGRGKRKVSGPVRQSKEAAAADYAKLSKVRKYATLHAHASKLRDRATRAKR